MSMTVLFHDRDGSTYISRMPMDAIMRFYRFNRNKEITAFSNENSVLKSRQPNVIGPIARANITLLTN